MSFIKKILSSFKNTHFQSLMGNGVMAGFGMLVTGLLCRALSLYDAGVYMFLMTIVNLVDTVKTGFLTNGFIRFYSGTSKERANVVAGSAWCLALAITAVIALANVVLYFITLATGDFGLGLFVKYFAIISLSTLPNFMGNLVVQSEQRFDRLLWLRLVNQVMFTGTVGVMFALNKSTLLLVVYAYIVTNFISGFIMIALGWTKIGSIKYFKRETFMELFHFGKYSMATSLSSNLFRFTDAFFLNFYIGPAAVAIYNIGSRLMQIVEIPLLSFAASCMPILSSNYNNNRRDELIYTLKKMVGMLSIMLFFAALGSILLAEPLISLLGGGKYTHSIAPNLFRVFISIAVFIPADRFFGLALDAIHKPQVNLLKIILMLLANLIGDFISTAYFKSIYGVAFTNIFPTFVGIAIGFIYLNKFYKFKFLDIYIVGYHECIAFIKNIYATLVNKQKTAITEPSNPN